MRAVADRLAALTGEPVLLAPAVVGPQVRELTERLEPGQMLMLENVRFEAGESRNEPALASALAELADLYVGDAFAARAPSTREYLGRGSASAVRRWPPDGARGARAQRGR